MLWITNVSQYSTTPSALAQRKGRQIRHEHRHSHIKRTFSKRDWPTRVCCVTLSLFCCIWTGLASTLRPLRHCWTNQRTVTHPSCTNGIIFAWITCMFNVIEYALQSIVSVVKVGLLGLMLLPAAPACWGLPKYLRGSLMGDNLSVMEFKYPAVAVFEKCTIWWHWKYSIWYT